MEFRFDPHDRRLRIRTMVPPGQHARTFVADELFQFENTFCPTREPCRLPQGHRTRCFKAPILALLGTLAGNSSKRRSRSLPNRIVRPVTVNWS